MTGAAARAAASAARATPDDDYVGFQDDVDRTGGFNNHFHFG
jgi:hypothetical protein